MTNNEKSQQQHRYCPKELLILRYKYLFREANRLAIQTRDIKDGAQRKIFGEKLSLLSNRIFKIDMAGAFGTISLPIPILIETKSAPSQDEFSQNEEICKLLIEIKDSIAALSQKLADAPKIIRNKKPYQRTIEMNSEGCLHFDGKNYQLKTNGKRVKIICRLSTEYDYITTSSLAEVTGYNEKCLRTTISEINKIARNNLKLGHENGDLIVGQNGRGYKINDNYYILMNY